MADLITSGNTTGDAASHTGPCTVWVSGDLKGGYVELTGGVSTRLVPMGRVSRIQHPGCYTVDAQGTYNLKATITGHSATPAAVVETTQ